MVKLNNTPFNNLFGNGVIGKLIPPQIRELEGITPLTLSDCKAGKIYTMEIYGNLLQKDIPSVDNQIPVLGVGDKTPEGDYNIPITIGSKIHNLKVSEPLMNIGSLYDIYLYPSNQVLRNVLKIPLTGNEDWVLQTLKGIHYYCLPRTDLYELLEIGSNLIYSNSFYAVNDLNNLEISKLYVGQNYIYFNHDNNNQNLPDFENWLNYRWHGEDPIYLVIPIKTMIEYIDMPRIYNIPKGSPQLTVGTELPPSKIEVVYA